MNPPTVFRTRPLLGRLLAATAVLACAGGVNCDPDEPEDPPLILPPCTCYEAADCADGQTCHWNFAGAQCANSGKLDGLCTSGDDVGGGIGGGDPGTTMTSDAVAMVNRGFDSFVPAILAGGAPGDVDAWEAMSEVSDDSHVVYGARVLVHEALTITLGWDVNLQYPGYPMGPGNVRLATDSASSLAMLEATREAVLVALQTEDPDMVSEPLLAFWQQHPNFEPGHLGRCYPHGHDGLTWAHPIQCQIDNLAAMMTVALASAGPEL